jgi:hypothetical protein
VHERSILVDTQALINEVHQATRREALQSGPAEFAKVTAVSDKRTYDLEAADGRVWNNRGSMDRTKFKVGDWVTIEEASGVYQVTGPATSAGG